MITEQLPCSVTAFVLLGSVGKVADVQVKNHEKNIIMSLSARL